MKNVCFIHSYTNKSTAVLERLLIRLEASSLNLDLIVVNNIGNHIDPITVTSKYKKYKIIVINFDTDGSHYENCTLRLMHVFSHLYPHTNLLYLHTKGVSYDQDHDFIKAWVEIMLYTVLNPVCTKFLRYVDMVGALHLNCGSWGGGFFGGNYWWSTGEYFSTVPIYRFVGKYPPEVRIQDALPTFVNTVSFTYDHELEPSNFDFHRRLNELRASVDAHVVSYVNYFRLVKSKQPVKISYGVGTSTIDITEVVSKNFTANGVISIPPNDDLRNKYFGDPAYGQYKMVKIGPISYRANERISLPTSIKKSPVSNFSTDSIKYLVSSSPTKEDKRLYLTIHFGPELIKGYHIIHLGNDPSQVPVYLPKIGELLSNFLPNINYKKYKSSKKTSKLTIPPHKVAEFISKNYDSLESQIIIPVHNTPYQLLHADLLTAMRPAWDNIKDELGLNIWDLDNELFSSTEPMMVSATQIKVWSQKLYHTVGKLDQTCFGNELFVGKIWHILFHPSFPLVN